MLSSIPAINPLSMRSTILATQAKVIELAAVFDASDPADGESLEAWRTRMERILDQQTRDVCDAAKAINALCSEFSALPWSQEWFGGKVAIEAFAKSRRALTYRDLGDRANAALDGLVTGGFNEAAYWKAADVAYFADCYLTEALATIMLALENT